MRAKNRLEADPARIRRAAMNLLARREYSRRELADRLLARGGDADVIDAALDRLAEEGLQSDARFAEAAVRYQTQRGKGPRWIRQWLQQRGVDDERLTLVLEDSAVDWVSLAQTVCRRRFGDTPASTPRDRARRVRFLQQRGFTGEQTHAALRALETDAMAEE